MIVLVENLPDDLLENVLERHDPRRSAVLVDDDRHVLLAALELAEEIDRSSSLRGRSTPRGRAVPGRAAPSPPAGS